MLGVGVGFGNCAWSNVRFWVATAKFMVFLGIGSGMALTTVVSLRKKLTPEQQQQYVMKKDGNVIV